MRGRGVTWLVDSDIILTLDRRKELKWIGNGMVWYGNGTGNRKGMDSNGPWEWNRKGPRNTYIVRKEDMEGVSCTKHRNLSLQDMVSQHMEVLLAWGRRASVSFSGFSSGFASFRNGVDLICQAFGVNRLCGGQAICHAITTLTEYIRIGIAAALLTRAKTA